VVDLLQEFGLEENMQKIVDMHDTIMFKRYKISLNRINPCVDRAQGVLNLERPKTRKSLQCFLGMINYDRLFIRNITEIFEPLCVLLPKNKRFIWSDRQQDSFITIKNKWSSKLEIVILNTNKEFTLKSDASDIGIRAILKQDGNPVGYISRSLHKAERNNGITEKDVLAALWAIKKD
jgi:hypothetical protein